MKLLNINTLLVNDKVLRISNSDFCAFMCKADSFADDLNNISENMDDFSIIAEEEYQDIMAEDINMEKNIICIDDFASSDRRKNANIINALWDIFRIEALFIKDDAPVRNVKRFHDFVNTGLLWQLKPT